MSCEDGNRRVATLTVAAGGSESYSFDTVPIADPMLHIHEPASEASVSLDLSADGSTWGEWRGWFALTQDVLVRVPRSVAALRLRSTEAVVATLSVLEDS